MNERTKTRRKRDRDPRKVGNTAPQLEQNQATTQVRQARTDRPVTLGFTRRVHSDILNESRSLRVYLPNGYRASERKNYALLVLSDGPWDFRMAASITDSLAIVGAIPRMVVVGIPNRHRNRDLIPMQVAGIQDSGGGGKYLASLESEVLPYVNANWPTNGFRIFSGHSLGGLTAINILIESPDLFDAYIALSPSMEVGDGVLLDRCREFLSNRDVLSKMLYLAVGDEYHERVYFDQLIALLHEKSPRGFKWGSGVFDDQDEHNSMRVTGALAGIRWVFRDWQLRSPRIFDMTYQQLEAHYIEATHRFKQPRALSVDEFVATIYWGLHDVDKLARSMELARFAVGKWPSRHDTLAAHATCLEATGNLEGALKEIKRAENLAQATAMDHVWLYQSAIKRIRRKLGRSNSEVLE